MPCIAVEIVISHLPVELIRPAVSNKPIAARSTVKELYTARGRSKEPTPIRQVSGMQPYAPHIHTYTQMYVYIYKIHHAFLRNALPENLVTAVFPSKKVVSSATCRTITEPVAYTHTRSEFCSKKKKREKPKTLCPWVDPQMHFVSHHR